MQAGKPCPLSSVEFTYWRAYAELEPFGPAQEDLRAGYLTAAYHNVHRDRNHSTLTPGDFFPSLKIDEPVLTPAHLNLSLSLLTKFLGGTIEKPK